MSASESQAQKSLAAQTAHIAFAENRSQTKSWEKPLAARKARVGENSGS